MFEDFILILGEFSRCQWKVMKKKPSWKIIKKEGINGVLDLLFVDKDGIISMGYFDIADCSFSDKDAVYWRYMVKGKKIKNKRSK